MTHPIRFEDALRFPFREKNRARLVWLPGSPLFVIHLLSIGFGLAALYYLYQQTGQVEKPTDEYRLINAGLRALETLASFIVSLPLMGYVWRMAGELRAHGENASPPPWKKSETDDGGILRYTLDGLKLMLYYIPASLCSMLPAVFTVAVIAIFIAGGYDVLHSLKAAGYVIAVLLVLISIFTMLAFGFFIAPFLYAPVVLSAHTRKLGDLFNLQAAWGVAKRHYATGLKATGWMIAAGVLYSIVAIGLLCTCIGFLFLPFLQFPYWIILTYLAAQVFPPAEETAAVETQSEA